MMPSDPVDRPLLIRLFGPPEILLYGTPLPAVRTRKVQWLLALLALRAGRAVERAWLAALLWLGSPTSQALALLRRELNDLRRALGPEAVRVRSTPLHTLGLDLSGAEVDVIAFDAAIARGDATSLEGAVGLYR